MDPGSLLFSGGYLIIYSKKNSCDRRDFHLKIIKTLVGERCSLERTEGAEPSFSMTGM